MSQSTTTAGSQGIDSNAPVSQYSNDSSNVMYSQGETHDPNLHLRYPDRQQEVFTSSESFVPCSLDVPLTQLSQQSPQSVSATPSPVVVQQSIEDKVRNDIARMNEEFTKHKYEAFVHGKMHLIFKVYPFDLEKKWSVDTLIIQNNLFKESKDFKNLSCKYFLLDSSFSIAHSVYLAVVPRSFFYDAYLFQLLADRFDSGRRVLQVDGVAQGQLVADTLAHELTANRAL